MQGWGPGWDDELDEAEGVLGCKASYEGRSIRRP